MPCGVSLKGVIYKMKFYCIATWFQRGHIILMQNVFNNILNLLNQFLHENTECKGGLWVGNQVMRITWTFLHTHSWKLALAFSSKRQGFQNEGTTFPQPGQCSVHLFKHSTVQTKHFPRLQMQIFWLRKLWVQTWIWFFFLLCRNI